MGGPPKPSSEQSASTDLKADLNEEEYQKLEEIVSEQEKAVQQSKFSSQSYYCRSVMVAGPNTPACCNNWSRFFPNKRNVPGPKFLLTTALQLQFNEAAVENGVERSKQDVPQ